MDEKKKILFFAVQFYPESTGYSFAATNFLKTIQDDYDITVMTPVELPNGTKELEKVNVIRRSKKGFQKYTYQFQILHFVLKNIKNYDVIFFDTAEMFFLGNIISKIAPEKTILRFHGCMTTEAAFFSKTLMMRLWKFFITKWIKNTKIIVSTTPYYIDFIKKYYLKENPYLYGSKYFGIVPNTIFIDNYNLPNRSEVFEKYQIDTTKFNMLTLGRMDKDGLLQKGIEDVIFALKLVEKFNKDFNLTIIGSGNKKNHLEKLVKSLDLEANVNFIEKAPHLDILALCKYVDATILFSRFEGMSMFAMESISFGCFPIFANVGGLKDLVMNEKSGFLVDPLNIPKLSETIINRMNMDDTMVKNFRKKSFEHFQNNFAPEKITNNFEDILNFVIPKRGNR